MTNAEDADEEQRIRNRMVRKMLRKQVVGKHNRTVDAVVDWSLASHEEGQGRQLLEEMATDPNAPIEAYGGHRNAVRLTSVKAAVDYLKEHGGDVPFGYE